MCSLFVCDLLDEYNIWFFDWEKKIGEEFIIVIIGYWYFCCLM